MENISYKLEVFEGPLDLLLHLISKHKLNIYDIEISVVVEQYLAYINDVSSSIELSGEFLEMAATLIYIKTVSLLPKHEEAETLKKELEGRLIEYSLCKKAALLMKERFIGNTISVRKQLKIEFDKAYTNIHDPELLAKTYSNINLKGLKTADLVKKESFDEIVKKRIVSVTSKIIYVLKLLYKKGECYTAALYDDISDRSERVAIFLAVLELSKAGRIYINEDNSQITFIKK